MSGVKIVLSAGDPAIVVDSIGIEGDRLCVRGRLLGTMQAKMYVGPGEVVSLAGLALRGHVLAYLVLLPFFWLRRAFTRTASGAA